MIRVAFAVALVALVPVRPAMAAYQLLPEFAGPAPNASANCGSGATTAGNQAAGRVQIGTAPVSPCTLSWAAPWANAPVCSIWDETSGGALQPQPTTTTLAILGSLVANHTIAFSCVGYR